MIRYQNKRFEQLYNELRYAPRPQKLKQIDAAEDLLAIVEEGRSYPYEFICFKITGYRPKIEDSQALIDGKELRNDLAVFIYKLSCRVPEPAEIQRQTIYTAEAVCEKFRVTRKTIQRWRNSGLIGRMFLFSDGKKRIAYTDSVLQRFIQNHPQVQSKKRLTRVTPIQKQQILDTALRLTRSSAITQTEAIQQIAAQMGRSRETIRCILIHHQDRFPDQAVIPGGKPSVGPKEIAQIYRLFRQGIAVPQIAGKFHRSRSSIYRIINKRRSREIFARRISYVESPEFADPSAGAILSGDWKHLCDWSSQTVMLNRDQETALFRRYNYLKYLTNKDLPGLEKSCPSSEDIAHIEGLLQQADEIKAFLIETNLRLVVSIANKHLTSGANPGDLVSEGNLSLMNAVEKFDYTRGYRFSTYASWAISKDFARQIPAETSRPDRTTGTDISNLQQNLRIPEGDSEAVERAQYGLEQVIQNDLDEREQFVVRNHFALDGSGLKKKPKTLQQIGEDLGLSKERVRQIELLALQKLRHSLSPEDFGKFMS